MLVFLPQAFWFSFLLVFYTYLGYGLVLGILVWIKRKISADNPRKEESTFYPEVAIVIAAYNEKDFIRAKIENSLALDYPADKFSLYVVADGSQDGTETIASNFQQVKVFYEPKRAGKIAAINRVMPEITAPITIFTDANTLLNSQAIKNLVRHFENPRIGAVAGEKRIIVDKDETATGAGEGLYWRYESTLKQWDAEFHTVVGAAGELFAIRTEAFIPPQNDTIIEDFVLSMEIAAKGFKVAYEPEAYAMETPSQSIKEELKRKFRIAAGGIQAIYRLRHLLNPLKYGWLSFQYISHRALRWTLAPLGLLAMLMTNLLLAAYSVPWYQLILMGQLTFYALALAGFFLQKKRVGIKGFFIPYYFLMMNYAVFIGAYRLIAGKQNVLWERSERKQRNR
jgi:biofilm PGA synthesis N-glycosyltransferase PgaC